MTPKKSFSVLPRITLMMMINNTTKPRVVLYPEVKQLIAENLVKLSPNKTPTKPAIFAFRITSKSFTIMSQNVGENSTLSP